MKNAIFQYYLPFNGVGTKFIAEQYSSEMPVWARRSVEYFKNYAEIHNADHILGTERFVHSRSNYFEACRIYLDPSFDKYDSVLYLDVDVMPLSSDENIFDQNFGDIAGWPEYDHPDFVVAPRWYRSWPLSRRFKYFGSRLVKPKTVPNPIRMINTGVVLWSRQARLKAREMFPSHESWFHYKNKSLGPTARGAGHHSNCLDQPFLNAMWTKFDFDVRELDIKWNHFPIKQGMPDAHFMHFVGDARSRIPELFDEL